MKTILPFARQFKSRSKFQNFMWIPVVGLVLATSFISFGARDSSQSGRVKTETTPTPEIVDKRDLSRYAITEISKAPTNIPESSSRYLANRRYDDANWVFRTIRPGTGGVGRIDESEPPSLIPAAESDLIVIGDVISNKAFLSNDLRGVYTEFEIQIRDVIKGNALARVNKTITADIEGGVVIYPGGERVLYKNSNRELFNVGSKYLLFLKAGGESPNYSFVTSYELVGDKVTQMDIGRPFDEYSELTKSAFVEMVREKVTARKPIINGGGHEQ